MVKKTMTIEKGVAIEVTTEALCSIRARLMRLEDKVDKINPNILDEINEFHIDIVRTTRVLSTKTINEIKEIKELFKKKYNYFSELLSE